MENNMNNEKNQIQKAKKQINWKYITIIVITSICVITSITWVSVNVWNKWKEQQKMQHSQQKNEEKIEENVKKLKEEKEYNGMKITNISIIKDENNIDLKATIQNTTKKNFKAKKVTIVFLNDKEEAVIKYRYYLNDIKVGESTEIELVGENISDACDFEIKD